MATVTMTGKEFQEMLRQQEMADELVRHIKASQQVHFPEKPSFYGVGKFAELNKFPDWLHNLLVRDMVQQLLHLPAEEFERWVATGQCYYAPKLRNFYSYDLEYNVNLLEYDAVLKERWDLVKAELNRKEEEANVGSDSSDGSL
jgi:hypothetical protein